MKSKFLSFFLLSLLCLGFAGLFVGVVSATDYTVTTVVGSTGGALTIYMDDGMYYREGAHVFASGTHIRIQASAYGGYVFDHFVFSGYTSGETSVNPISTTVQGSFSITAYFVPTTQNYNVNFQGGNDSTCTMQVNSGVFYNAGNYSLQSGTLLRFNCVPDTGYYFEGWYINGSAWAGSNPVYLSLANNIVIFANTTAVSGQTNYYLTVNSTVGGHLDFSYTPAGGSLPVTSGVYGTYQVDLGSNLQFVATADAGYEFVDYVLTGDQYGTVTDEHFNYQVYGNLTVYGEFEYVGSGSSGGASGGWGINWDVDLAGQFAHLPQIVQVFMLFLVVFAPPLVLLMMAPKVGMAGFAGMFSLTLSLGVFFFGLPPWILFFVAGGIGLMLFSLMYRN